MISSPFMPDNGEQRPSGPPDYKVYRSRRGLFSRLRKPRSLRACASCARRPPKRPGERRGAGAAGAPEPRRRSTGKRVLKWVGIAALGWILLSFLAFAVSAQLQSFKLSGEAKDALHGNPFLLPSAADDPRPRHRRPPARHQGARRARTRRSASNSRPTATPRTTAARSANSAPTR